MSAKSQTPFLRILTIILFLSVQKLLSDELPEKKTVWFLAGHMQDIFGEEYLKPMLISGYDLRPMHQLKNVANESGYELIVADPNANELTPFSHEKSGMPEVALKNKSKSTSENFYLSLQNYKAIIVFEVMPHQIEYLARLPKEKLILFLWEPPSVMPQNYESANHEIFSKVYTWNDQLVDNQKYFKFSYPVLQPMIKDIVDFDAKKLCTLIAGNRTSKHPNELYTERRKVIEFFDAKHPSDFDLYGKWWPGSCKTYKGPVENKVSKLKYYKFCIAYENVKNIPGYITEKIFDCFQAGCVPVYLGASNIGSYVPKTCFIDRSDFESEEALYTFLKNMRKEQYQEYIKNIQNYLVSEQAQVFSSEHFVQTLMKVIKDEQKSQPKNTSFQQHKILDF